MGIKPAAIVQMVLTLILAVVGLMLIFGSSVSGDVANLQPLFVGGAAGIMAVAIMTPFMFVGFDVIPQAAEEMNIPFKSIGKILIVAVLCAVVWYLAIIFGVGMALSPASLENASLATADAMGSVFASELFAKIMILGGIAGIMASRNAFIIGGSRVIYAMAKSGMLPAWLVDAGGLAIVMAYFMVALAFLALRKKEPDMERPFKAGRSTVIGWIALVLSFGFIVLYLPGMPSALVWPYEWLIIVCWWFLGIYFMINMNKGKYVGSPEEYLNRKIES
ncbi:amino acid transporter [Caldalkalibacillus uzonensis]|uniref:Amino acid transporter n=1 Tax=Caldalkalibacillus uzonensis TaxID=353224 RepID=A0ABU0CNL2_9BACI|nr:amino acid transporter [Caldalkalibacillus uzonensis]